jgi:hypothetical protein
MNPKNKIDRRKVYVSSYFPVTANFAGEATPLKISDVKERLDRELIVNIKSCVHHFSNKTSEPASPVIEPILKRTNRMTLLSGSYRKRFGQCCIRCRCERCMAISCLKQPGKRDGSE